MSKKEARGALREGAKESAVRKNMATVHFTTIPYEPTKGNRHMGSHIFFTFCMLEILRTFLCVFVSVLRVFVPYELWVDVLVAIFLRRVDCAVFLLTPPGNQHTNQRAWFILFKAILINSCRLKVYRIYPK